MDNKEFRNLLLKKSYQFSLKIIKIAPRLKNERWLFALGDQLLRAATSIGANISEARGSSSKREFKNYIQIAFKSCWETRYWLGLIKDSKLISGKDIELLVSQALELHKILNSILLSLKGNKTLN